MSEAGMESLDEAELEGGSGRRSSRVVAIVIVIVLLLAGGGWWAYAHYEAQQAEQARMEARAAAHRCTRRACAPAP